MEECGMLRTLLSFVIVIATIVAVSLCPTSASACPPSTPPVRLPSKMVELGFHWAVRSITSIVGANTPRSLDDPSPRTITQPMWVIILPVKDGPIKEFVYSSDAPVRKFILTPFGKQMMITIVYADHHTDMVLVLEDGSYQTPGVRRDVCHPSPPVFPRPPIWATYVFGKGQNKGVVDLLPKSIGAAMGGRLKSIRLLDPKGNASALVTDGKKWYLQKGKHFTSVGSGDLPHRPAVLWALNQDPKDHPNDRSFDR